MVTPCVRLSRTCFFTEVHEVSKVAQTANFVRTSLVVTGMSVGGPDPVLYSLSSFPLYRKALRATTRHRRSWTAPLLWPKSVWRVVTCLVYVRTSLVAIGMSVGGPDPVLYSLSSFSEGPC